MKTQASKPLRTRTNGDSTKSRLSIPISAITLLAVLAIPPRLAAQRNRDAKHAKIIIFDPPGSIFTNALSINPSGKIVGAYLDASNVFHGFVRAPDGTFTAIDAPGGGTGRYQGSFAESINAAGDIVGAYLDASYVSHGFLRTRDGAVTTFDAPGGGTNSIEGISLNISPSQTIVGDYSDASNVFHGFIRSCDGTITPFDVPDAGTGSGQGTFPSGNDGVSPAGSIVGDYLDASNVYHGFLRTPDGAFTTFDIPGAGTGSGQGTQVSGINPAGSVSGLYIDDANVMHSFVRGRDGAIAKFDAPGAGTGAGQGTSGQGTQAFSTNPADVTMGTYFDASDTGHGFLRVPCREGDQDDESSLYNGGATEGKTAPVTEPPSTASPANPALRGRGMLDWLRSPSGLGYRFLRPATGPTN
jgi:hypothetical protein